MKRLTYLLAIIGAIVIVVLVGYFLRYRAEESTSQGTADDTQTGGLPDVSGQPTTPPGQETPGQGTGTEPDGTQQTPGIKLGGEVKFGIVAQNPVAGFHVDENNNAFIVQPDGQIIKISGGEASTLSSSAIKNLANASFSRDGKKIFVSFGERRDPQHSIFNVETNSWNPVEQKIMSASWSRQNQQMIYARKGDNGTVIARIDFSQEQPKEQSIFSLRVEDPIITWLDQDNIIISEPGSALLTSSAWLFNIKTGGFVPLVENRAGTNSLWDPESGSGLIFGTGSGGRGGNLELLDLSGNRLAALSTLTMPRKCAFGTEEATGATSTAKHYLYCAVPKDENIMKRNILPDNYDKMAFFTNDNIYRIDTLSGNAEIIPYGEEEMFDAEDLKIFNGNIFFVNRLNKKLYAISLE